MLVKVSSSKELEPAGTAPDCFQFPIIIITSAGYRTIKGHTVYGNMEGNQVQSKKGEGRSGLISWFKSTSLAFRNFSQGVLPRSCVITIGLVLQHDHKNIE